MTEEKYLEKVKNKEKGKKELIGRKRENTAAVRVIIRLLA